MDGETQCIEIYTHNISSSAHKLALLLFATAYLHVYRINKQEHNQDTLFRCEFVKTCGRMY